MSFDEASSLLSDPSEHTISVLGHSEGEYRFLSVGKTNRDRLVMALFTERLPNSIRTISARIASKKERQLYESRIH